mgnify:CR=1 FL=1
MVATNRIMPLRSIPLYTCPRPGRSESAAAREGFRIRSGTAAGGYCDTAPETGAGDGCTATGSVTFSGPTGRSGTLFVRVTSSGSFGSMLVVRT